MHTTEIIVRGYHLDVFGHVNNGRYLEFLEEARWALFARIKSVEEFVKDGFAFNVVNINIDYRQPVVLSDVIVVESVLGQMGKHSATLVQTVKNKMTGAVVAEARVTFVMLDLEKQKAALLEGKLKEELLEVMQPQKTIEGKLQ